MSEPLRVLAVGTLPANLTASSDDIVMVPAATLAEARTASDDDADYDAIVIDGQLAGGDPASVEAMAGRAALIVVLPDPSAEHAIAWLRRGAQDVIPASRARVGAASASLTNLGKSQIQNLSFRRAQRLRRRQNDDSMCEQNATGAGKRAVIAQRSQSHLPPLKWSSLMYVFDEGGRSNEERDILLNRLSRSSGRSRC